MVWLNVTGESVEPSLFTAHVIENADVQALASFIYAVAAITSVIPARPAGMNRDSHGSDEREVLRTDALHPLAAGIGTEEYELVLAVKDF